MRDSFFKADRRVTGFYFDLWDIDFGAGVHQELCSGVCV